MTYKHGTLSISGVKQVHTIEYTGPGVSNNTFYSGGGGRQGWRTRQNIKVKYHKIFDRLVENLSIPWMEEYIMVIIYNSRHDPGNVSAMEKLMSDTLKQERLDGIVVKGGYFHDDSKKYCKGVHLIPDESLAKNTFKFQLLHLR